jgi:hypothetical protein
MKNPLILIVPLLLVGCESIASKEPTAERVSAAQNIDFGPFPDDYESQIMSASMRRWSWAPERVVSSYRPRKAKFTYNFGGTVEYCYAAPFGLYRKGDDLTDTRYRKFVAVFIDGRISRIERISDTWLTLSWMEFTQPENKEPNQALEPTPTAVTDPAAQAPRQP